MGRGLDACFALVEEGLDAALRDGHLQLLEALGVLQHAFLTRSLVLLLLKIRELANDDTAQWDARTGIHS